MGGFFMEFQELFGEEFFIINSDNLNSIKKKLYGFGFNNSELILEDSNNFSNLNGLGSYVLVDVDEEFINISQDFNGCYGIYLYVNEDYFAISNSFLYLVEFLKDKQPISFNKDYADSFLFSDLVSLAYGETLINEIEVLPRNYRVIINKKDASLNYDEIDYQERSIPLDSHEGIKILDSWYFKWVNIIRNLKSKTNNIEIDLSGGLDTRIIAALWLTSNIDLNQIKIRSLNLDMHCIPEDYRIASQIADEFNFKLNDNSMMGLQQYVFKDIKTIFNISNYIKLGFHKQLYWRKSKFTAPYFSISGNGGELLRSFYNLHTEEFVSNQVYRAQTYDDSLVKPTERIIKSGLLKLQKKLNINDFNSKKLPERHYKEVRSRNHFGKTVAEKYFSNVFTLCPLMDPDIHKIKIGDEDLNDMRLLFILILLRYCPKLLDFEIEGGRKFDENTIKQAKCINKKYAFENFNVNELVSLDELEKDASNDKCNIYDPDLILKKISNSNFFEVEFKKYYPPRLYNHLIADIKNRKVVPLTNLYSALAILQVIDYVNFNSVLNYNTAADWIQSFDEKPKCDCFLINSHKIEKYNTARIDLINMGGKNNFLEIMNISDDSADVLFPEWYKNENGQGSVIQTQKSSIKIKLKCINDGNLSICIRGVDYRDSKNNKIPIYIIFKKLLINDEVIFDDEKLVWNDACYIKTIPVVNGEIISLNIEWSPI